MLFLIFFFFILYKLSHQKPNKFFFRMNIYKTKTECLLHFVILPHFYSIVLSRY